MTCRSSAVFVLAVLSGALALVGCSDCKKGFVLKGSVSYQGKSLSSGMVRLHMAENRMAMAMIQSDGSFEATDVFPGEAKVTIEEDSAAQKRMAMAGGAGAQRSPAPGEAASAPPVAIPPKYKDVNTSDLVYTLKAGTPLNIELK
jgi:hypothetical protein